jgi:hypothetical protein
LLATEWRYFAPRYQILTIIRRAPLVRGITTRKQENG